MKLLAVVLAAGLALAAALPAPAQAQNTRSFVSGHGVDTNACTLAAPCRTLAAAFAVTDASGEIDVLDTAGYGPLTISKAISIVNDGGTASVLVPSGGVGITIKAGTSDAVSLRGLTIDGAGVGLTGITFTVGKSLTIENCVIRHLTGDGIDFNPDSTSNLLISSSLVADNSGYGISVVPTGAGTVKAVFNRIETNNNQFAGIFINGSSSTGTIDATVTESVSAGNINTGFAANTASGQAATTLMIFHSVAANNVTGIQTVGSGAIVRLAQSMVTGSTNGWLTINSAVLLSDGDNTIEGNGANQGAPTTYARK